MNYQVLARKYRPRTFQQMVGQEHVLRALINALEQKRLHHAYLFSGNRGIGKTTIARILAKSLNCEKGITAVPCEQCLSCQEISQGRFVDLIEVDAASRTKVEDTRDLLDNVQYAPTRGRYKVYLIDEVHMLSNHSFNALLKTLEEPPPHVIFLLATTDPQKLPVTVLSRCLQFNLRNLSPEKIHAHLMQVLTQENISYESKAVNLLAKAANGSLRDALSLLDQAIAFSGGKIEEPEIRSMLGTIEQTYVFELLEALNHQDANAILVTIDHLAETAVDFNTALEDLLSALHHIALKQMIADHPLTRIDYPEKIESLATQLSRENVQLFYQIGLIGKRDLYLAPTARSGFEMILLRMLSFQPAALTDKKEQSRSSVKETSPQDPITNQATNPVKANTVAVTNSNAVDTVTKSSSSIPEATNVSAPRSSGGDWPELISQLKLTGFVLALAQNCMLKEKTESQFHLLLDPSQAALQNPKRETSLNEALSAYLGRSIKVKISLGTAALETPVQLKKAKESAQLQAATTAIQNDENVQAILKLFDAKIEPGSIQIKDS